MIHKRKRMFAFGWVLGLTLMLAACGGGGSATQGSGSTQGAGTSSAPSQAETGGSPTESKPALERVDLKFATNDPNTGWYPYGASMAQLMQETLPSGSTVDVLPYSGAIGNATLVSDTKEAHLGLVFNLTGSWAYNGVPGTGYEKPLTGLRMLVGGLDQYWFGAMVPANVPFNSLAEVKEKQMGIRVVSQPKGSLGDLGTWMLMEAYGITEEDIKSWGGSVTRASTDVNTNAIKDRRADFLAGAIVAGHPGYTELAQTSDIRFLSFEDEIVEKLKSLGMSRAIMPANTFHGQTEDAKILGYNTAVVVDESMDEELAYLITKTIIEGTDKLKADNKGLAPFDPKKAWTKEVTSDIPLHPGAERFYKEVGYMP